jgi:hypothetical protein
MAGCCFLDPNQLSKPFSWFRTVLSSKENGTQRRRAAQARRVSIISREPFAYHLSMSRRERMAIAREKKDQQHPATRFAEILAAGEQPRLC